MSGGMNENVSAVERLRMRARHAYGALDLVPFYALKQDELGDRDLALADACWEFLTRVGELRPDWVNEFTPGGDDE